MKFNDIDRLHQIETLYVSRPLTNESATDLKKWANSVGFQQTLAPEDMHVTIAFSKKPVDWSLLIPSRKLVEVLPGNRKIMPLGDKGAVVLKIDSIDLTRRWNQFVNIGCSWDYKDYSPHVTISYQGGPPLEKIVPYDEPIYLLPEKWKLVNLNWDKEIKETN